MDASALGAASCGTFYAVAGKIFTEQPMILSKDGVAVGKFIV